mgnify:FL=1
MKLRDIILNEMSKTASVQDAEKELRSPYKSFKVGKVSFSKDGTSKFTITRIDPETGQVSWNITKMPGFNKLFKQVDNLVDTSKVVYQRTKEDSKFREFYQQARQLRNDIRRHLRNEYPEDYKRIKIEENEDE